MRGLEPRQKRVPNRFKSTHLESIYPKSGPEALWSPLESSWDLPRPHWTPVKSIGHMSLCLICRFVCHSIIRCYGKKLFVRLGGPLGDPPKVEGYAPGRERPSFREENVTRRPFFDPPPKKCSPLSVCTKKVVTFVCRRFFDPFSENHMIFVHSQFGPS